VQARIIWGANLIPLGAACGGDDTRRRPTRSRAPANGGCNPKVRTAARSRRPAGALGVAASMCGRRPIRKIPKQKARGGFPRAGFAIFAMMALCR